MSGTAAGGADGAQLVDYLVARDGVPEHRGLAYDYVLAGDGLFIAAENAWLSVRVPVARFAVRGLPPVYPACRLAHGRIPVHLWHAALDAARKWGADGQELVLAVAYDRVSGYRLTLPQQLAGATRVVYAPPTGAVMEMHSHHILPARFSRTDDLDEQRLCLYGVIGRLDRPRPHIALRAGAYGHWFPVPWESVFDGDAQDRAAVHDARFDGPDTDGAGDPTESDSNHHEWEKQDAGNKTDGQERLGDSVGPGDPDGAENSSELNPSGRQEVFFGTPRNGEGGSESTGGWHLPD